MCIADRISEAIDECIQVHDNNYISEEVLDMSDDDRDLYYEFGEAAL